MIDLFTAADARDEGIDIVSNNALSWFDQAASYISQMNAWTGTGEDMRMLITQVIGEPHHHNAWGAMIMAAVRKGDLIKTGEMRKMVGDKSHARMTPVYVTKQRGVDPDAPAKRAYQTRGKGQRWPLWENLGQYEKDVWRAVAKAVMEG